VLGFLTGIYPVGIEGRIHYNGVPPRVDGGPTGVNAGRRWGAHGVPVASPAPPRLMSRSERAMTTAAVVATHTTACAMTSLLTLTVFTSGAARYFGGYAT